MTAEIAIMNKSGVALAADSAVTISSSGKDDQKVYNSANKLFSLSKHASVAIMVYDSASIMGVPWEVVIKSYRKKLDRNKFDYIKDYQKHFVQYLEQEWDCKEGEGEYVTQMSVAMFFDVVETIDTEVNKYIEKNKSIKDSEIRKICRSSIKLASDSWNEQLKNSGHKAKEVTAIKTQYKDEIEELIDGIFEKRPLNKTDRSKLLHIAAIFAVITPGINNTGVVIAGYGEKEYFPSVYDFNIGKILNGNASISYNSPQRITHDNKACILPFAQSAEVYTFMEGMGNKIQDYFFNNLSDILKTTYPSLLSEEMKKLLSLNDADKKKVENLAANMGEGVYDYIYNDLSNIRNNCYSRPVINAVSYLSAPDLSVMAETFVNLESFRKRVTFTSETVGGPIDVLIITKGDGLIWIKRKHYFNKELNHHYFVNYFDEDS